MFFHNVGSVCASKFQVHFISVQLGFLVIKCRSKTLSECWME
jgi:hypothetical protein